MRTLSSGEEPVALDVPWCDDRAVELSEGHRRRRAAAYRRAAEAHERAALTAQRAATFMDERGQIEMAQMQRTAADRHLDAAITNHQRADGFCPN